MKHQNQKTAKIFALLLALVFCATSTASAGEAELLSKLGELQKNMEQMQKTIALQNQQISELQKQGAKIETAPSAGAEAVSAAPPMSDYEFGQRLDSQLGGAQKWLKDLKFSGDLRLRYEAFANHGTFSDPDRNRFRFRLRYGFEKKFSDDLKAGFSMASGEGVTANGHNSDPTSTNQTFGNDFNFKNIWIEKAYAVYNPHWAKIGPISDLELSGGKFTNPFERGSSDMVFDRDLKPEGAYEKISLKLIETDDVKVNSYLTAGQFVLQENKNPNGNVLVSGSGSTSTNNSYPFSDAEMYGIQFGINPIVYTPWLDRPVDLLSAISYFDYSDYSIARNWRIDSSPAATSLANGNSICSVNELCTGFKVLELYNEAQISPYGIPFRPFIDYAHNTQAGRSMQDQDAWGLGLKVGKLIKKGDWEAMYQYKWIGADSVPGAFTDSDFGYRGYAGNEGSVIKLGYNLTDYLTLNTAAYIVRNLNIGSALDYASTSKLKSEQQSRFQVDLVWKF